MSLSLVLFWCILPCSFDDLRIRREKKDTKQKVQGGRKQSKPVATANEKNDKIACLRFTAVLEQPSGPAIRVSAKSRPIILGEVMNAVVGKCFIATA